MSIFTNRMQRESETIKAMVRIYCKHHHARQVQNCESCRDIQNYALDRLQYCPYQEGKTSCKSCPIHCYKPSMKDEVKIVMRYSGPRMMLRHPILTVYHLIDARRSEPTHIPMTIDPRGIPVGKNRSGSSAEPCEHLVE